MLCPPTTYQSMHIRLYIHEYYEDMFFLLLLPLPRCYLKTVEAPYGYKCQLHQKIQSAHIVMYFLSQNFNTLHINIKKIKKKRKQKQKL